MLGSKVLREYLVNFCRPFIYTTALPQSVRHVWEAYITEDCSEKAILKDNIVAFKEGFSGSGLIESESPIQCVVIGGNDRCKKVTGSW